MGSMSGKGRMWLTKSCLGISGVGWAGFWFCWRSCFVFLDIDIVTSIDIVGVAILRAAELHTRRCGPE
jgi:hypothetical protein